MTTPVQSALYDVIITMSLWARTKVNIKVKTTQNNIKRIQVSEHKIDIEFREE